MRNYWGYLALLMIVIGVTRWFIMAPYFVPSKSMLPTLEPGDAILVTQYNYGLFFPIKHTQLLKTGLPKRGDIAVFYSPVDFNTIYVKRVIGLPGDTIAYQNKKLIINGQAIKYSVVKALAKTNKMPARTELIEALPGVSHKVIRWNADGFVQNFKIKVPAGQYLMLGDNRDQSNDSRVWGLVPSANLIGKVWRVAINLHPRTKQWRANRLLKEVL